MERIRIDNTIHSHVHNIPDRKDQEKIIDNLSYAIILNETSEKMSKFAEISENNE